jgi:hypothetical protein
MWHAWKCKTLAQIQMISKKGKASLVDLGINGKITS